MRHPDGRTVTIMGSPVLTERAWPEDVAAVRPLARSVAGGAVEYGFQIIETAPEAAARFLATSRCGDDADATGVP